jgi:hypothetical protein
LTIGKICNKSLNENDKIMNIKFIAHDAKSSSSCQGFMSIWIRKKRNDTDGSDYGNFFFNQEYSETQLLQNIKMEDVKDTIDSNKGSETKRI